METLLITNSFFKKCAKNRHPNLGCELHFIHISYNYQYILLYIRYRKVSR